MFITYAVHVKTIHWCDWSNPKLKSYLRHVGRRLVRSNISSIFYHSHTKGKPERINPHIHVSLKIDDSLYNLYANNLREELARADYRNELHLVEPFKIVKIVTWTDWTYYNECYLSGRSENGVQYREHTPELLHDRRRERVAIVKASGGLSISGDGKTSQLLLCPEEGLQCSATQKRQLVSAG